MKVKIRPHLITVEKVYVVSLNGEPVGMIVRMSPIQWILSLEGRAAHNGRDVVKVYKSLGDAREDAVGLVNAVAEIKPGIPAPKPRLGRPPGKAYRKSASRK
jgi:hypothetical protein